MMIVLSQSSYKALASPRSLTNQNNVNKEFSMKAVTYNKLSTGEICKEMGKMLWHLYRRHEVLLLETGVTALFTYLIVTRLG